MVTASTTELCGPIPPWCTGCHHNVLVVLSPVGTNHQRCKTWITLFTGFTIQPGEFAKIIVILAMAMVLSERDVGRDRPSDRDVRQALIWAAAPVALIMPNRTSERCSSSARL